MLLLRLLSNLGLCRRRRRRSSNTRTRLLLELLAFLGGDEMLLLRVQQVCLFGRLDQKAEMNARGECAHRRIVAQRQRRGGGGCCGCGS